MNQKLTVLSLASALALTPLSTGFAQMNTSSFTESERESESRQETDYSDPHADSDSTNESDAPDTDSEFDSDFESEIETETETDDDTETEAETEFDTDSDQEDFGQEEDEDTDASDRHSDSEHESSDEEATEEDEESFEYDFADFFSEFDLEDALEDASELGELRFQIDEDLLDEYLDRQEEEAELFSLEIDDDYDYASAIADLQQSLEENPENQSLYVELALTYLASGDLSSADEISKQLNTLASDSYLSLLLQAELAGSQGNTADKQLYLQKAVESDPTSSVAQFKLGEELAKAGQHNEAAAHLIIAAALNPDQKEVFEALNNVFAQSGNIELTTFVNGVVPTFDVKPFIEEGRTLMPVRAISEALGANVGWDDAARQISIQHGETTIQLVIDSNVAIVNGQETSIDVPAKIVDGNTVLPLRFVSEALGANVDWKAEGQLIVISE